MNNGKGPYRLIYQDLVVNRMGPELRRLPGGYPKACAWMDLIFRADFNTGDFDDSLGFLATRWSWSRPKVARYLAALVGDGALKRYTKRDTERDTYHIEKYDLYQGRRDTKRDTNRSQVEQYKNRTTSSTPPSGYTKDFELWWSAYPRHPRKKGKAGAFAKWKQRHSVMPPVEEMLVTLKSQSVKWKANEDGKYTPGPIPYLNRGDWDEDVPPPPKSVGSGMTIAEYQRSQDV